MPSKKMLVVYEAIDVRQGNETVIFAPLPILHFHAEIAIGIKIK